MPTPVTRAQVLELVEKSAAQLVEVLAPAEYEAEHLPGAVNVPLTELDAEHASVLDPLRPVVVYCWDGL